MAYPTTFLDLQDEVIAELRLEDDDRDRVKDWINRAYAKAAIQTEALQQVATAPVTAGESTYTLPTPVVRIKELRMASVTSPTGFGDPLSAVSLSYISQLQSGSATQTGAVQNYTLIGEDEIIVWPTPTTADIMWFLYTRTPTPLDDDTDTLELQEPYATDLCKYGACMEAAALSTGFANQDYRQLFQNAVAEYRVQLSRRRGIGVQQFELVGGLRVPTINSYDSGR